jgi:hypothetical protein
VPQIFDFIDRCGLAFGRWVRQAPYLSQCGALAKTTHSSRLAQLPEAEQYSAVELFRGTMVRHSFLAYRDDRPGEHRPITFGGDRWLDYVPIRLPETISVQKKLPPGAAAVLINQEHTSTDLILPVDANEKRLFDAIDGKRNIDAIIHDTLPDNDSYEWVGSFFERLWQYDQVVFDASKTLTTVEM